MRYMGGLLGGTWLTSLCGDLGNGKFADTVRARMASCAIAVLLAHARRRQLTAARVAE
jgi:Protein of unknown function (DUF3141)